MRIHTAGTLHVRQNDFEATCLFANGDLALVGLRLSRRFLGLAGGSLGQISLVPFSLCVGQVIPLIVVERQAKFTLITTNKIIKIRTTTSKSNQIKRM